MGTTTSNTRTRSIVFCGLSMALIAVSAMVTIPLGPIPFTLQTAVLALILCVLTPGEAICSVAGYLVLGLIGLPVFSGMRGGISVLMGPTGGFLIGFLLGIAAGAYVRALICRLPMSPRTSGKRRLLVADITGVVILEVVSYIFGLLQLAFVAHMGLGAAFLAGAAPFIVPDIIKAVVAIGIARPVRVALGRENIPSADGAGNAVTQSHC